MKKFFTMMVALFALLGTMQAQNLLYCGFDDGTIPTGWTTLDNDNDGYTWDASTPITGEFYTYAGAGCIASASYINNLGALTPDNWLITPQITISGPTSLTFYVRGQDASWALENFGVYVSTTGTAVANFTSVLQGTASDTYTAYNVDLSSYVGQSIYIAFRHYNTSDMYWLNLDEVTVFQQPTTATIVANPTNVTFPNVLLGAHATQQVNVTAYALTSAITATTTAPFAVSADGTNYATTASIPATGGTLYIKYTPTAGGTNNGTVTLASSGETVTVNLTGTCIDCSNTIISQLPYQPDFSNGFNDICWLLNSTVDSVTWTTFPYGDITYASCLGASGVAQDEKLISPSMNFTNYTNTIYMDMTFAASYFWATCTGPDSLTTFAIYASTDGGQTWGTNPIWNVLDYGQFSNYEFLNTTIDLSSLGGQSNVKLMFRYEGALHSSQVLFGNLNIYAIDSVYIETSETSLNFSTGIGSPVTESVVVSYYNITTPVTATTAAPYAISTDNVTFATTATITSSGTTLYVKFDPTTAGTNNGNVTFSATGATNHVLTLNGDAIDCSTAGTVPFTDGFNYNGELPICYTFIYGDNNPAVNPITNRDDNGNYVIAFSSVSRSDDYNQYMISPALQYTGNADLVFAINAKAQSAYYDETFSIGYSTTTNDLTAFTWSETYTATTDYVMYDMTIPANATYVAIHYSSNYALRLYVDDLSVTEVSSTLRANPTSLDFGTVYMNRTATQQVTVTGRMLTADIAVTTTAPFAVSIDGNTFATTATMPAAGGTLYVQYAPTAEGTNNGVVTLSSTGVDNVTIDVTGNSIDCSQIISTLPWREDFSADGLPACWILESTNSTTWTIAQTEDGSIVALYCSYAFTPQDEKISTIPFDFSNYANENIQLSFDFLASMDEIHSDDPEEYYNFYIYASTDGGNTFAAAPIFNLREDYPQFVSGEFTTATIDLTPFAGQNNVVFQLRYEGNYGNELAIDYLLVETVSGINDYADVQTSIYPNPANTTLNIQSSATINVVEIYTLAGAKIATLNGNDTSMQVNVANFANGIYFAKVITNEGSAMKKFSVVR